MEEPQVLSTENLLSFRRHQDDWNDNMLTDDWEAAQGIAALPNAADRAFRADPDNDGLYNFEEEQLGTDPLAVDSQFPPVISRQVWADVPVFTPHVLGYLPDYPTQPYGHDLLRQTETPIRWGSSYAARIQGYITAPITGIYNLFVCGRLKSELWLSTDESKFNRRKIASSDDTHQRDWSRYRSQNSGDIQLEAGKKYYFEIRYMGHWGDHAGMGWRKPGELDVEIIGQENISYFYRDADDLDNDDLPDSWEVAHNLSPESAEGDDGYHGDRDGDGLINFSEWDQGSSPIEKQSDTDPVDDLAEYGIGTDPTDPASPVLIDLPTQWALQEVGYPERSEVLGIENGIGIVTQNHGFVDRNVGNWKEWFKDHLAFVNTPISGDFEIVARVVMNPSQDPRFLGGLVFRESIHEKAGSVGIFSSPDKRFEMVERAPGDDKKRTRRPANSTADHKDMWLKLLRKGDTFYAFTSANGTAWQPYGYTTMSISKEGFVGFANAGVNDMGQVFGCAYMDYSLRIDSDSDGLYDSEELEEGSDPHLANSDGDDIDDYLEKYEYYSDPTVIDVQVEASVQSISGNSYGEVVGEAIVNGSSVSFKTGRGILHYPVQLPEDGLHQLEITGQVLSNGTPDTNFGVQVSIDGQYVRRLNFDLTEINAPKSQTVILPWLKAGSHTLRLFVDNSNVKRSFQIDSIAVNRLGGPDADGNGKADWIEGRLQTINGIEAPTVTSHVSPFCLEGRTRFLQMLNLGGDATEVKAAPTDRWYANVDLEQDTSKHVTLAFENGGLTETVALEWKPLNIVGQNVPVQSLRKGDTLLSGVELGEEESIRMMRYRVFDSEMNPLGPPEVFQEQTSFAHTFNTAGTYTITVFANVDRGKGNQPRTEIREGAVVVDVVDTSFPKSPVVLWGFERPWVCPDLAETDLTDLHLETDTRMFVGNVWETEEGGLEMTLRPDTIRPRYILARLGDENGPIIDSQEIRSLNLLSNRDTSLKYIDETEGGDLVVEMWMVANEVYDDVQIDVDVLVGGVTLFDGSNLRRYIADDFDELGVSKVLFIKSPSVAWNACHRLLYLQDGVSILRGKK